MKFWPAFFRLAPSRPRLALAALYWHGTGRRVRARNRLRIAVAQSPHAYRTWIETVEAARPAPMPTGVGQDQIPDRQMPDRSPLISVIAPAPSPAQRAALEVQGFGDWEWAESPETAKGAWLLPLPDGAVLPVDALARYAEAIAAEPHVDVLYADHDIVDRLGRRYRPWFKPEWDAELLLAQDYVSQACAIRAGRLGGPTFRTSPYAALLAIAEAGGTFVHVPHILAHLPPGGTPDAAGPQQTARLEAVARHVGPMGGTALAGPFGTVRVAWPLPDRLPLVSIVVPTRDKLKLLRCCLDGVLGATDYPNIEVIVVDNGSRESTTLAFLAEAAADPRVRVLRDDGDFNFSRLNNRAAREARGSFLCLLNNDIEIINSGWLTALMRQAVRPHVGAVGAKLLYDDGSIQHAGVVIGMGEAAGHAHRFLKDEDEGYFAQAHVARQASAVTAACLVVEKRKFEGVGGLDEEAFAVAFNDVDFCLKLGAAGWRNIYEPAAVLIHHESKSRGRDTAPEHLTRYRRELTVLQSRWGTVACLDPQFHPALDPVSETYLLRL